MNYLQLFCIMICKKNVIKIKIDLTLNCNNILYLSNCIKISKAKLNWSYYLINLVVRGW